LQHLVGIDSFENPECYKDKVKEDSLTED